MEKNHKVIDYIIKVIVINYFARFLESELQ